MTDIPTTEEDLGLALKHPQLESDIDDLWNEIFGLPDKSTAFPRAEIQTTSLQPPLNNSPTFEDLFNDIETANLTLSASFQASDTVPALDTHLLVGQTIDPSWINSQSIDDISPGLPTDSADLSQAQLLQYGGQELAVGNPYTYPGHQYLYTHPFQQLPDQQIPGQQPHFGSGPQYQLPLNLPYSYMPQSQCVPPIQQLPWQQIPVEQSTSLQYPGMRYTGMPNPGMLLPGMKHLGRQSCIPYGQQYVPTYEQYSQLQPIQLAAGQQPLGLQPHSQQPFSLRPHGLQAPVQQEYAATSQRETHVQQETHGQQAPAVQQYSISSPQLLDPQLLDPQPQFQQSPCLQSQRVQSPGQQQNTAPDLRSPFEQQEPPNKQLRLTPSQHVTSPQSQIEQPLGLQSPGSRGYVSQQHATPVQQPPSPRIINLGQQLPNVPVAQMVAPELGENTVTAPLENNSLDPKDLASGPTPTKADDNEFKRRPAFSKLLSSLKYRQRSSFQKRQDALKASHKTLGVRAAHNRDYDPKKHYKYMSNPPPSWDCFTYTKFGELEDKAVYTTAEIQRYLYDHPLHNTEHGRDPKNGGLILWIQRKPADSGNRYAGLASSRCRFSDCCGDNNLIDRGQWRVAFDEQSHKMDNNDPFYNAGYVHLFCLERFLNFLRLCFHLNVRVENRILPNEPRSLNRMIMSTTGEAEVANDFIQTCQRGQLPHAYPHHHTPSRPHQGTLTHALAVAKFSSSLHSDRDGNVRKGHEDSYLARFLGDLKQEARMRTQVKVKASLKAAEKTNATKAAMKAMKRKYSERCEYPTDELDSDAEYAQNLPSHNEILCRGPIEDNETRPAKRSKRGQEPKYYD